VHRAVATRAAVDAVPRALVSISKGCIELLDYLLKSMVSTSPSLFPNGVNGSRVEGRVDDASSSCW